MNETSLSLKASLKPGLSPEPKKSEWKSNVYGLIHFFFLLTLNFFLINDLIRKMSFLILKKKFNVSADHNNFLTFH